MLLMVPYLCGNPSGIFQQKCRFEFIFWLSKVLFTFLLFVMLCKRRPVLRVNYCSMSRVCAALPLFHLHKSCFMKQSVSESVTQDDKSCAWCRNVTATTDVHLQKCRIIVLGNVLGLYFSEYSTRLEHQEWVRCYIYIYIYIKHWQLITEPSQTLLLPALSGTPPSILLSSPCSDLSETRSCLQPVTNKHIWD